MADAVLFFQAHLSKTPIVALGKENGIVSKSFCARRLLEYLSLGDPLKTAQFSQAVDIGDDGPELGRTIRETL